MKIIVTGTSGFIGFHLCQSLLKNKKIVVLGHEIKPHTHKKIFF